MIPCGLPYEQRVKVETRAPDGGRLGGKICRLSHVEWLLLWWSDYLAPRVNIAASGIDYCALVRSLLLTFILGF